MVLDRYNTVFLCNAPLYRGDNVIKFSSVGEQISYFQGKTVKTERNVTQITEPTPQGIKNYIRIDIDFKQAKKCNYVMYKNDNEEFYQFAFIDEVQFLNDRTTQFLVSSDPWNNYQFRLKWKNCLFERETPNSWGEVNTLADSPSVGQQVQTQYTPYDFGGVYMVFCSTDVTQDDTSLSTPYSLNIGNYCIPCWCLLWKKEDSEDMGQTLNLISRRGWSDRIISVVYLPFINEYNFSIVQVGTDFKVPVCTEIGRSALNSIVSFSPKVEQFGKLNTYPYQFIRVTDRATGQYADYSREKFSNGIDFSIRGTVSETPYYKITPQRYEGKTINHDKALVIKSNTILPHINNLYAKYMKETSDSNQATMINALASMGVAAVTQNPSSLLSSTMSTFSSAVDIYSKESQARKLGNTVSNFSDGAYERLAGATGVEIALYEMDAEHKKSAVSFWKRYGYPCREFKVPSLTVNNGDFKYIKMVECNITGDGVPSYDMKYIQELFEKGVTLWKPSTL